MEQQEVWQKYGIELKKIVEQRTQWYKHITLVASSLFGILVSLRPNIVENNCSTLIFVIAISLLSFAILCFMAVLFEPIHTSSTALMKYLTEAEQAIKSGNRMNNIQVNPKKFFVVFQYMGIICFIISILLLSTYLWLLYY